MVNYCSPILARCTFFVNNHLMIILIFSERTWKKSAKIKIEAKKWEWKLWGCSTGKFPEIGSSFLHSKELHWDVLHPAGLLTIPRSPRWLQQTFASIIYKTLSGWSQKPWRQLRLPSDRKRPGLIAAPCCQCRQVLWILSIIRSTRLTGGQMPPICSGTQFKSLMRWLVQFAPPTYFAYFEPPVIFQRKCKTFG